MQRFSHVATRFLSWADKCLARSTVNVYKHYFRRFVEHHGDLHVRKLQPAHLQEWADTWHATQAIKRLFNWALLDAGLVKRNPFERVKHPPKGQRRRIMNRKEMCIYLRRTAQDLRALLTMHRETFARPEELRVACWDDVQFEGEKESLRQALLAGRAVIVLTDYKARKRRRLPSDPRVLLLSPRAGRLLVRLLDRAGDANGPIFLTSAGRAWTPNAVRCRLRRLRTKWKLARDKRGENVVPYTFRHTGATRAAAHGVRDRLLADILGHVETSTTRRYQHLDLEHLRTALGPLWFGNHGGKTSM